MNWEKLSNLYENAPKKSEIGAKLGVNQSNFLKIMREKKQIDVLLLEKIASYFGKSMCFFFDEPDASELNIKLAKITNESLLLAEKLKTIHEIITEKNRTIAALESHIETLTGKKATAAAS